MVQLTSLWLSETMSCWRFVMPLLGRPVGEVALGPAGQAEPKDEVLIVDPTATTSKVVH